MAQECHEPGPRGAAVVSPDHMRIQRYLDRVGIDFADLGWDGPEESVEELTDEDAFHLWDSLLSEDPEAEDD